MARLERRFTLRVPSSTENLALIRHFVGDIGRQAGLDESERAGLEIAVDEACANVIEHACGQDPAREVAIHATVGEPGIAVEVTGTGKGFDPGAVEPMELERLVRERRAGGLGMRLMRMLMDEVHYRIVPGVKNEVRMIKRLNKRA